MKLAAQLISSLVRVFPAKAPRPAKLPQLRAPRGGRASFQVAFVVPGLDSMHLACRATAQGGIVTRVRRVGAVPMPHYNTKTAAKHRDGRGVLPGMVPDPLIDGELHHFAPGEGSAFWVSLSVPLETKPGRHAITVELQPKDGAVQTLRTTIEVAAVALKPRVGMPMTHWFHVDCLADRYGVAPYDESFWPLCEKYVRNYVEHGLDCLYVPVFTPPLDGVRKPEVQLLGVTRAGQGWRFDWSRVERWIAMARRCGVRTFEWSHLFTQWGVERALRIYDASSGTPTLLWPAETGATSDIYRGFLAAFLPELKRFLDRNDLVADSFFHVSDEPHGAHLANYRAARAMLRELAPWMTVMDALSEIEFGAEGLVDHPIPVLSSVPAYRERGIDCWAYYCCWPRGAFLNRLLDTPLTTVAMHGFLFHATRVQGFLHWGFNYWYRFQTTELIDPFQVSDAGGWPSWAHGDTFVVYPGVDGPIDSIRWEIFAEAMQDLALMRQLGVDPDSAVFKGVNAFDDFPREEAWIHAARKKLLAAKPARASRA
ncbi:MAG: DUF4091 domain-containing protein [Planctomycetes bacterium]|nr:DUF4091 domain-containing protein [Planctomycetota bacterium]